MLLKVVTATCLLFALAGAFNLNVPADLENEITKHLNGAHDPKVAVEEWLNQCNKETGMDIQNQVQAAAAATQTCISSKIKLDTLAKEIETAVENKKGELDDVFQSRCNLIPVFKECRKDLIDTIKPCLSQKHLEDLDTLIKALDAGLDYICHNGGERLALFMAEDGVDCFTSQSDNIFNCLNSTSEQGQAWMEEIQQDKNRTVFTEKACQLDKRVQSCVEDNLNKCKDPTTANLVEGLMKSMTKVTPCFKNSGSSRVFDYFTIITALILCFLSRSSSNFWKC